MTVQGSDKKKIHKGIIRNRFLGGEFGVMGLGVGKYRQDSEAVDESFLDGEEVKSEAGKCRLADMA